MKRKAAIRTKEGPDHSSMDADGWRRILASNNFGTSSIDFRKAFANVVQTFCTDLVDTHTIEVFLAWSLISLGKNPGYCPIGVGEVLQIITGKVIVLVLNKDVIKFTGTLHVRSGQGDGIERAIYSMNMIYEDENTGTILWADASNVFNSLSRQSFL